MLAILCNTPYLFFVFRIFWIFTGCVPWEKKTAINKQWSIEKWNVKNFEYVLEKKREGKWRVCKKRGRRSRRKKSNISRLNVEWRKRRVVAISGWHSQHQRFVYCKWLWWFVVTWLPTVHSEHTQQKSWCSPRQQPQQPATADLNPQPPLRP